MEDVGVRFISFKINILKLSILLTAVLAFFFFLFHISFDKNYILAFLEFFLTTVSFYFYKFISINNYKLYAIIEYLVLFLTILALSIVYPNNVYLPIWMFGTLIVFTLCTNLVFGIVFLIISIVLFDLILFNRLNIYSFLTLNFQFIAYFVFGVILIKKIEELQKETFLYEKFLFDSFSIDSLTGLLRRGYFEGIAEILLEKAKRNNNTILFMIIDIDYFKLVNDTYGHPMGDLVLRKTAEKIKQSLRKSDLIGRIGGEEFAVLIDNYKEGFDVANKIKENVSKVSFKVNDEEFNITVSIGGIITKNYDYEYLYKMADKALYEAKKERNKVVIIKD